MTPLPTPTHPRRGPSALCLLLGGVMGRVVAALAAYRPGDGFALAMAVVFLAAGSAAMVSWQLARGATAGRDMGRAQVPGWLLAIGLGVLAGLSLDF